MVQVLKTIVLLFGVTLCLGGQGHFAHDQDDFDSFEEIATDNTDISSTSPPSSTTPDSEHEEDNLRSKIRELADIIIDAMSEIRDVIIQDNPELGREIAKWINPVITKIKKNRDFALKLVESGTISKKKVTPYVQGFDKDVANLKTKIQPMAFKLQPVTVVRIFEIVRDAYDKIKVIISQIYEILKDKGKHQQATTIKSKRKKKNGSKNAEVW